MPKNKSMDAAEENASADSLSFAGLLCIAKSQNIHLSVPPPTNNSANTPKLEDLDFKFSSTISGSTGPVDALNNNSLADVLFSNGQLVPQAIQLHTSQSQVLEHVNANVSSRSNSKRANESAKKTNTQVRNKANKQQPTVSQWFGQKIIRPLATPCRNCGAIQPSPSMKEQALRQ